MMSSSPYGPPETMKYVAAMSGRRLILGEGCFAAACEALLVVDVSVGAAERWMGGFSFVWVLALQGLWVNLRRCEDRCFHPRRTAGYNHLLTCAGELAEWLKAAVC
jgi:hypothetical protein